MDPCIKEMVSMLRLPNPLKRFLAWILKYIVSVGPGGGGVQSGRGPERKGLRKGKGADSGAGVGSERRTRPREGW